MDLAGAKQRLIDEVDARADLLLDASHQIHARPELCFEEHFAHDLLTDILEGEGIAVERHAHGCETGFAATIGEAGPLVAVMCEYDALPGIGHACGHNIIATAGLGAGLAAAALADELGGRVRILGTPAEEGGGGKIIMMDHGALDEVDAALMIHPAGRDLRRMNTIAIHELSVEYSGKAAHAAAAPHLGRNALDAAVLGYMNIAALRQHIRSDERIHGVFTDGGDKPNIVPAHAAAHWYVRAGTIERLRELEPRVEACLRAGAEAAGCDLEITWKSHFYTEVRDNEVLLDLYAANSAGLGRPLAAPTAQTAVAGSTDMGNVSYRVPSIHPMIKVSDGATSIHTPEFATFAAGPDGDRAVLDGAKAIALTVADLWLQPEALDQVRSVFEPAS